MKVFNSQQLAFYLKVFGLKKLVTFFKDFKNSKLVHTQKVFATPKFAIFNKVLFTHSTRYPLYKFFYKLSKPDFSLKIRSGIKSF